GDAAKGYVAATFHQSGAKFKIHDDIKKFVYDKGKGKGEVGKIGEVLYNRGLVNAFIMTEAIRDAVAKKGKAVTGSDVRDAMENLNLDQARIDKMGFTGMMRPIKNSCADHEGNGSVLFQQWDGKEWKIVSDWIAPMRDVVRPMIEASATKFATENKLEARKDCN